MSNGEKKPGVKDISDLKARLGMLNKGVGAKPGAPGPAAAPPEVPAAGATTTLTADSDAELGMATQVVRVEPREAAVEEPAPPPPEPKPAPRTIPGPPAAAPPPPPLGGPLNLGADLFKPAPPPEPVRAAPVIPAAGAPGAGPAAQGRAAPAAAPAAAPPQEKFVNPLAGIAAQTTLTADDEDVLASVEKGQKGVRPVFLVSIAGMCAVIAGGLGLFAGRASIIRDQLENQTKETAAVRDRVVPILEKMEELANVVEPMSVDKGVEWQAVQNMPDDLPGIDAAGILSTRVTLEAEIMTPLGKAVADLNQLFMLAVDHKSITLKRDKAELDAMEKGSTFSAHQFFAAVFTPGDPKTPPLKFIPPNAQIVAVVDKPHEDEKGETNVVKVKYKSGQEAEVPLQRMVLVDKTELFEGGRQNPLNLYRQRVQAMKDKIKTIRTYSANLKDKLNRRAADLE